MKGLVTVGLDGTLQAMAAARWAAREAELRRARLLLLHAWIPRAPGPAQVSAEEETTGYAPHRITEEARAVILASHPDLAVQVRAVCKDPLDALVKAADESDLLVLGSRGLGAAARFTLGETGLELVTRTAVPTVLVRAQQAVPARIGSGNVTVGVSLHGTCDGLLAFAFETAARRAVMLRAVHGRRLSPYAYNRGGGADRIAAEEAAQIARKELAAALRPWRKKFPDVHVDAQVILESPAPALLHGTVNAELLVVGRRPGGRLLPPRIGHVVQAAVHHAPCPVAVVPFD